MLLGSGSFSDGTSSKESVANAETEEMQVQWKDPLEERMAMHSSVLREKLSWTEEPGRLTMGLQSQT